MRISDLKTKTDEMADFWYREILSIVKNSGVSIPSSTEASKYLESYGNIEKMAASLARYDDFLLFLSLTRLFSDSIFQGITQNPYIRELTTTMLTGERVRNKEERSAGHFEQFDFRKTGTFKTGELYLNIFMGTAARLLVQISNANRFSQDPKEAIENVLSSLFQTHYSFEKILELFNRCTEKIEQVMPKNIAKKLGEKKRWWQKIF